MRIVKALAVIIPLIAATLALVFTVRPSLKPCVGASGAEFTGVPVFPHVRFRDHLFRSGASRAEMRSEPNILGAEVRFSYKTDDLRGAKLPIRWTLVSVEKDGTLGAVDRPRTGRSRCSSRRTDVRRRGPGHLRPDPRQAQALPRRSRALSEQDLQDRLALEETPIFSG